MAEEITEYLDEAGLKYYDSKRKTKNDETYVKKEFKTGSESEYKGLSDNNLTDELLRKIENAGDSSFTGNYNDLSNKPSIDGVTLDSTSTAEGLGLAKSEKVAEDIQTAKGEMETYVDSKLSSTYKPAGSIDTIEQLPTLTAANLGKVYNVAASFVTTDNFIEGSGKDYPAGTNVVVVEQSTDVYKYDALAGFVDMSGYLEKTAIQPIPNSKIDALFE